MKDREPGPPRLRGWGWAAPVAVLLAATVLCFLAASVAVRTLADRSAPAAVATLVLGLVVLGTGLGWSLPRLRLRLLSPSSAVPTSGRRGWPAGLLLLVASTICTLVLLEVGLRVRSAVDRRLDREIPLHVACGDCPELYRLNPDHPDVGPRGLRSSPVLSPKPEGLFRILVLGDSVTYGILVPEEARFTDLLERRLDDGVRRVEVVNAGVSGYTAYNELQAYRRWGPELEPDLTLVVFVVNDVAVPSLHWGYTRRAIRRIPEAAVPDPDYARRQDRFWRRLHLVRFLRSRLVRLRPLRDVAGWDTRITGEDPLSIEVLLDDESPEWRWLRRMYGSLDEAVRADGGRLAVVVMPIAYQLDEGYPHRPQRLFDRYFRESGVPGLDLLPAFLRRAEESERDGGSRRSTFRDRWHLTEEGHAVAAAEIERFLRAEGLVPSAAGD